MNIKKLTCDYWEIVQLSTQGKRRFMEDSSVFLYPFTTETSLFVSVFDGHAGSRCSSFLSQTLPHDIQKETQSSLATVPSEDLFVKVFSDTDQQWLESAKCPRIEDGSTALCVAFDGPELIVANCGDCRAILSQSGQIQPLTRDHKPTDEFEEQRIMLQGGTIIGGRLQGQLGVSRAFGNYEFKESQILSSDPEIHQFSLTSDVEILVVGSDGLYEHFSNEEIIAFIKTGLLNSGSSLEVVVKELVAEAIDRGSEDNITIIVVKFEKAFKKFLKKRAKKLAGKSSPSLLPSGKSSPLRTSGKAAKHISPETPSSPESKSPGLFRKGKATQKTVPPPQLSPAPKEIVTNPLGIGIPSLLSEVIPGIPGSPVKNKKRESKKIKQTYEEEKWNSFFSKPFKSHDFFGRIPPVTISG